MFGAISESASGYSGSFVRFKFDTLTARVQEFTVLTPARSTQFFLDITPLLVVTGSHMINGSTFEYSSSTMSLTIHNNPTAALNISSMGTQLTINFTLSSGINARRVGSTGLNLTTADLKAHVFTTGLGTISLIGNLAMASLPPGSKVIFRMSSVAGEGVAGADGQDALADAAMRRNLMLESYQVETEGFVASSDVSYNGLTHTSSNVSENGFNVTLYIYADRGIAALHIHTSVFYPLNGAEYVVRVDGVEIARLATVEEVADYNGSVPVYASISGINGILLLVYFSSPLTHVFNAELVSQPPGEEPLNPIYIASILAIAVVFLIAAAMYMLRRGKRKSQSD